jgi:hypothetical protein
MTWPLLQMAAVINCRKTVSNYAVGQRPRTAMPCTACARARSSTVSNCHERLMSAVLIMHMGAVSGVSVLTTASSGRCWGWTVPIQLLTGLQHWPPLKTASPINCWHLSTTVVNCPKLSPHLAVVAAGADLPAAAAAAVDHLRTITTAQCAATGNTNESMLDLLRKAHQGHELECIFIYK